MHVNGFEVTPETVHALWDAYQLQILGGAGALVVAIGRGLKIVGKTKEVRLVKRKRRDLEETSTERQVEELWDIQEKQPRARGNDLAIILIAIIALAAIWRFGG